MNVTDISLAGNNLVLKYFSNMQGTPISTVMTLTPDGAGLRANMAVMDGQYQMSGTATKQAPGAPVRASGFGGGRGAATSERPTSRRSRPIARARPPRKRPASCCRPGTAWSSSPPTPT